MTTKELIIIEISNTGHRISLYLDLNTKAALDAGYNVKIWTTYNVYNSEEFQIYKKKYPNINIQKLSDQLFSKPKPSKNYFTLLYRQIIHVKNLNLLLKNIKNTVIVFNTFDDFVYGFWFFKKNIKLSIRAIFVSPKMRSISGFNLRSAKNISLTIMFYFAIKKFNALNSILVIDEFFMSYLGKSKLIRNKLNKICLVNDVGEVKKSAIINKAHNEKNLKLLVYGSITMRKGLKQLLESISSNNFNLKIELIIAGKPDDEVISFLESYTTKDHINLKTYFCYVSDHLESELFWGSDVVWLGYSKEFISSSGVLYQAWSAHKPVIACSHGLIGARTKKYNAGILIDVDNNAEIVNALSILGKKDHKYEQYVQNAKIAGKKFNKKAFVKSLTETIYA